MQALWGLVFFLVHASGYIEYFFRGLEWGEYTLKAGGQSWDVLVDGDDTIDLAGKATMPVGMRRAFGVIMILVINLGGMATILRIWRRSE